MGGAVLQQEPTQLMTSPIVRPATKADARKIAPLLRRQDRREIKAASGRLPGASLALAFDLPGARSIIFAETSDGDPILIAGVRETQPNVGAIWMLGTPLLEDYAFRFPRMAKRQVTEWHKQWPLLWNMAMEGNSLHMRWLQFMGFKFLRRLPHRGHTFIEFARLQHV